MPLTVPFLIATMLSVAPTSSTSYYPVRLDDAKAVYVTSDKFPVHADGVGDDTEAIQKAIDKAQETTGQGIVFLPSGTYRLTNTINVWPGIRVIGYGPTRPTLLLAASTPGYQDVEKYMIFFAGRRPQANGGGRNFGGGGNPEPPRTSAQNGLDFGMANEASPGTFYSAMSNIDLEVKEGNPAAVGVRGRYAQHCYLAHMEFRLGSALAGIHDTGNSADDLHFVGGQYGLITRTPSPGWQFTLLDSTFEGQSVAAIRTRETGLTLIRPTFRKVPTAITIDPDHTEQLWLKDGRMEDISGPAIQVSREKSLRLQLNIEDLACRGVPTFALFRESGRKLTAPGESYAVHSFSHGLHYSDLGANGEVKTVFEAKALTSLPAPVPSDVPTLPPADTWANLMALGAKGDGTTDDTEVLRNAIANHRVIYLPSGKYKVTDTIRLKPDTILIGLNPITTQILTTDGTPAFAGVPDREGYGGRNGGFGRPAPIFTGEAKPLVEAPQGGTNVITGIGLDTGGNNPAATALKWMAGTASMVDDVKFLGGHGSNGGQIYNANNSADPNPERKWDSQYPSLWVTNGGGGTFKNIWTASTFAQAGMLVSDTTTEGRVYEMSSEHHVRHEVQLHNAANWKIYALQTEEERGESPFCLPLDIQNCRNITVANLNMYRVVSMFQPFPQAVKVSGSRDIRFRGVHCYSNSKVSFDSLLFDQSHNFELRQREFAYLDLSGSAPKARHETATVQAGHVEKLAGGFYNISGGAVDPHGDYYFVDARWQRIYKWDAANGVTVVQDSPTTPTNLVFDKTGNLMVISYAGKGVVYAIKPGTPGITILKPEPATARPGKTAVFPVTDWQLNENIVKGQPMMRPFHYVSPDGTTFIPAGQDFIDGTLSWGTKLNDVIRAFGLAKAVPDQPFYLMGESETRTFAVTVEPDGTMTHGKLFAEQGGEGLAVDSHGNVYIAAGQIYIYDPAGKPIGTIDVPERPVQLMFGGKDGKTLFIAARTSLYSVRVK